LPEINTDACGRSAAYPREAQNLGIEGDVKLRVTLDERGAVQDVRVLSGLGHGLDREAVNAIRFKCKFTPAIGGDGRPVPYVIDPYVFHFEIPR
jgi:TonB family protein